MPSVAIMPSYFSTKIGLVIGIAASGSSMGGIIYPIMFYKLVDQVRTAFFESHHGALLTLIIVGRLRLECTHLRLHSLGHSHDSVSE